MPPPPRADRLPRVLVVDDHVDTLTMMGRIVSTVPADGVPVPTCAAAREAAARFGDVRVAIVDLTLPDGDGLELLAELKAKYGCAAVVLSGHAAPPPDEVPAWVDLWLVKPTSAGALCRAVRRFCPALGANKTILIVDDREESVWALYTLLERQGHLPVLVNSGANGLSRLAEVRPDAIVLDLSMPGGMDGYQFLDRLRADPHHARTRVVVYTGYDDRIDVKRLVAAGVNEILVKSMDPAEVAARLAVAE
jgi:CheY-like chemotaxis protein